VSDCNECGAPAVFRARLTDVKDVLLDKVDLCERCARSLDLFNVPRQAWGLAAPAIEKKVAYTLGF